MGPRRGMPLKEFWSLDMHRQAKQLRQIRWGGSVPPEIEIELIRSKAMVMDLAGNVADMSATCRPDSQMLAHLADMPLLWRHKIDPDTTFLCLGLTFLCRGLPTFSKFSLSTRATYSEILVRTSM